MEGRTKKTPTDSGRPKVGQLPVAISGFSLDLHFIGKARDWPNGFQDMTGPEKKAWLAGNHLPLAAFSDIEDIADLSLISALKLYL